MQNYAWIWMLQDVCPAAGLHGQGPFRNQNERRHGTLEPNRVRQRETTGKQRPLDVQLRLPCSWSERYHGQVQQYRSLMRSPGQRRMRLGPLPSQSATLETQLLHRPWSRLQRPTAEDQAPASHRLWLGNTSQLNGRMVELPSWMQSNEKLVGAMGNYQRLCLAILYQGKPW